MTSLELVNNLYPAREMTKAVRYRDDYEMREKISFFFRSGLPIYCYSDSREVGGERQGGVVVETQNYDGQVFRQFFGGV